MNTQASSTFTIIPAAEKVQKARLKLIMSKPFWGTLLMRLKIEERANVKTFITDGVRIQYSPEYVAKRTVEECTEVLAHEVAHCALRHMFRMQGRDHETFQQAADHVVNLLLRRDGMALFDAKYCDPDFEGMSVERVYEILRGRATEGLPQAENPSEQESESASGPGEFAAPGSLAGEEGEGEGEEGEGEGKEGEEEGEESGQEAAGGGESSREAEGEQAGEEGPQNASMTEAAIRELEQDWAEAATNAAQQALQRGHGGAYARKALEEANKPPRSFIEVLSLFIQRCASSDDLNWCKPNRGLIASGLYLPSASVPSIGTLAVAIDVSGSINARQLGQFCDALERIRADLCPAKLRVLFADEEVLREVEIDRYEPLDALREGITGDGGTDFRPTFMRCAQIAQEEELAGIIYFSDLDGYQMKEETYAALSLPPLLWVQTGPVFPRCIEIAQRYGEVISIEA
jgi:predicted metal-dependent peptidase